MLSLIYLMNTKVQVTIRTPIGESQPFICSNIVKQGTVLGPVLNNCSVDDFSKSSCPHDFGNKEMMTWFQYTLVAKLWKICKKKKTDFFC